MTTAGMAQGKAATKAGTSLTWTISIAACLYFIWTGVSLFLSTRIFVDMFVSMGVELPLPTMIVLASFRFSYPVIFGGAAILVIAKQFYISEKWVNISSTLGMMVVMNIISNEIVATLYRPLLDLMEKLSK